MLKKYFLFCPALLLVLFSCKSDKNGKQTNEEETPYFPALSFLQSQVAHIDTSLYSIIMVDVVNDEERDTQYIKREEFRALAKDFLEIPDVTTAKMKKRFKASKNYEMTLERVVFSCDPIDPDKEQLQKQEVTASPDISGYRVNSIFLDLISPTKDSIIEKKMLWRVDRSFQITTIKQMPGGIETITTKRVIWNEPKFE